MARDFKRTDRVSDQIQRDLATLIQREIKDPRLGMVTISHVKVSKDLGYADVYFTFDETVERGRHLHGLIEKAWQQETSRPDHEDNDGN